MIDSTKEYIIASAIHYDDGKEYNFQSVYGVETGFVICGFRHPLIISVLPTNPHYEIDKTNNPLTNNSSIISSEQGFLTSRGRFVNRMEGANLAILAGQVENENVKGGKLYSEDVFPEQTFYSKSNKK